MKKKKKTIKKKKKKNLINENYRLDQKSLVNILPYSMAAYLPSSSIFFSWSNIFFLISTVSFEKSSLAEN